ncbi:hypothetical protein HDU88_007860 [Geranomyces variabilis]|nr:hypothetical protein HDU88_007860 [Geranomyces variabilis]
MLRCVNVAVELEALVVAFGVLLVEILDDDDDDKDDDDKRLVDVVSLKLVVLLEVETVDELVIETWVTDLLPEVLPLVEKPCDELGELVVDIPEVDMLEVVPLVEDPCDELVSTGELDELVVEVMVVAQMVLVVVAA